ncbi:ankyrin repeat domain-containing protein 49-like isoform X2 [Dendronephthya gigantea]|nr:ankyrin repeat domain-containing protein 49-like isoform X2 [Dendronephthya gigantea]
MASAGNINALYNDQINDPACFLPEGSESLYQYIREDLENDTNSDTEELTEDQCTSKVFLKAAEKGRVDSVLKMLEKNESLINCKDFDGYSALHRASYNGHVDMVKVLLNHGADICSLTENMWQPLHCACRWDQTEVASVLLQNHADINAQTSGGQTPLHLAATYTRDNSLLQVLLTDKKLDPKIVNCQNETALDLAKRSGKEALFELVEDSIIVQ